VALAAATAETWGISGPSFLLVYLLIAVAVGVAGVRARRALAEPATTGPAGDLTAHPHDVAYLNGGGDLAVYSALSAMHLRGTIATKRGSVQATGRLEPDADALERAIHRTATGPVLPRRLPFHRSVQTAMAAIEDRLMAGGFLLTDEQRWQIRRVGLWMLGVAAIGLVRMLAGVAEARPVGFLVVALLVVTVVAVVQLSLAPRRSRHGDRTLCALRAEHHGLSPEVKPDWRVYGPNAAALGIGIFGTSALWASDPVFAGEIAVSRSAASATGGASGFAGSGAGGGGGGCGG
jgi:uncharacterized protein (TIGR04222 family)